MDQLQLRVARKILPDPPVELHSWSVTGGGLTVDIESITDAGHLSARMPSLRVHEGMHLVLPINLDEGGGYDVICEVTDRFYRNRLEATVSLAVLRVERRKPYRSEPRAALNELCLIRLTSHRPGTIELEGKIVDLSSSGIGITTDRALSQGDRLEIATHIGPHELRCTLIALHSQPASFGRYRIGCKIASVSPRDLHLITEHVRTHVRLQGAPSLRRRTTPRAA
jgi:hypothetical protein